MELTAAELTPAQIGFLETSIDGFDLTEWRAELAGQAASTRRFFRVSRGETSYILVEWDSRDEDWPRFLGVGEYAALAGMDILPKIYASDPVHGLILEEDLGAMTLKQFCVESYNSAMIYCDDPRDTRMVYPAEAMYRQVIDALRGWHALDVSGCGHITSRSMDAETFLWESGYFAQYCVIGFFGKEDILSFDWENERKRMAERAASIPKVNMHRDFQSENVMIHGGRVRFIDYQGARLGPAHYDAASLIFDPYVDLGVDVTGRLIDYYLKRGADADADPGADMNDFYICAAQRLMQALGAYGNLSLHKGKPHYRKFIPIAVSRLSDIFNKHLPDYPVMREVVNACKQCL